MSTLAVDALNKRYKSRIVVHDVSLTVGSGEVIGLLGPNGAGKTTCFYMIVGLVATDGGRIELDGEDLTRMPIHVRARLGLSYLPQEASIFRKLSVSDNVQAILELQGIDTDEIATRIKVPGVVHTQGSNPSERRHLDFEWTCRKSIPLSPH